VSLPPENLDGFATVTGKNAAHRPPAILTPSRRFQKRQFPAKYYVSAG
jgi:hypothetical protein